MFKIITLATAALIGLLANAQVTETRNVSPFNKLEITDGVEIIYTQGDQFTIRAEASDALGLSTLLTESKNNTLKITCKGNLCETAKVFVTAPEITSITASRNAQVTVADGIKTNAFSMTLASGATFRGNVYADKTQLVAKSGTIMNLRLETVSVTGRFQNNAKVNLSGKSESADIRTFGSALCLARNFKSGSTAVKASGNASMEVSAIDAIDVEVTDDAVVRYFGFPQKTTVNPEAVAQVIHDSGVAFANE